MSNPLTKELYNKYGFPKIISDEYLENLDPKVFEQLAKDVQMVPLSPHYHGYEVIYIPAPEGNMKKVKAPKIERYNTIGVRFLDGNNLAKVYTYRVPKKARLHLGQEVVVPTDKQGTGYITSSVAVVVEIHKTPQDNGVYDYKFIKGTVKPL